MYKRLIIILPGQCLLIEQDCLALLLPLHLWPPCFATLIFFLLLYLSPRPQDLEQEVHLPQEDHLQCTEKNEDFFILTVC